jgi:hypothetical protein
MLFSTFADFPTVYSGGPTADDIHDVPIVHAAAVSLILPVSLLQLTSLHAIAGFTTFESISTFAGVNCVGGPIVPFIPTSLLASLLLLASRLGQAFFLLLAFF